MEGRESERRGETREACGLFSGGCGKEVRCESTGGGRIEETSQTAGVPDDGEGHAEKGWRTIGQGGDFSVKKGV